MLLRTANVPRFGRTLASSAILKLFDSQKYFANFNLPGYLVFSSPNVGLFRNSHLTSPDGLVNFSKLSLTKAKSLVTSMLLEANNTEQGKLTYIRKLDQLSDTLCRVIDVAEFIRVVHSSQKWVDAAQNTHEMMFEYMNQLNTNVELYRTLCTVLDLYVAKFLSDEEIEVGKYLRQDFERSGIAMDPDTRKNFVMVTQQISLLGSTFNNEIQNMESFWVAVPRHEFEQIESDSLKKDIMLYQNRAPQHSKTDIMVPLAGHIPSLILSLSSSEDVRKRVWIGLHNSLKDQLDTLNAFLKYRALLSNMLGYKSFSQYQLEHKMAKNPENVVTFLRNLQKNLLSRPDGVVAEIKQLHDLKNQEASAGKLSLSKEQILRDVKPWDRDFLLSKQSLVSFEEETPLEDISEYLSVGSIMSGLDELFRSIYNVALVPQKTMKGETWNQNQVRKLSYIDLSNNEILGHLYVDFWSSKVLPSHFTLVCSRELNTDIGSESTQELEKETHLSSGGDYQLPVISLVCNFLNASLSKISHLAGMDSDTPTLLSLEQVDTIFHEMGHATHSMLGRTRLHNLSGTRCATDFVELPSVLMELFSSDPRVLCKIAKHYKTGEPLPLKLLESHQRHLKTLKHTETYMQSKMALLDQALHSDNVVDFRDEVAFEKFDSTEIYHKLEKELQVFADLWSTWHGKFPHLFSYGAVYYSYLLDRAIAEKIWKGLFENDPWSRDAGEKYKQSILKWGGTRDPWVCLADALDEKALAKGDARAMALISEL
ncbi:zincin [Metschnikowia bicuspidata var. bicuspidata NRRL YB-4993]|uniref:Mitochondrial intermediate peptidase n=1 Tax=Metschnikowia bicuspidata var. bicuspidata NRRL YB-4993 TaxID=869754 RepID=A0A1A0H5R9_9ASCO|nr:zincin [Metschnikowia bicuspidata var. bicuspidata NRRL YB-4993]OBA19252.1 zincin [Metschnikowia bicuspidata var. bicuspidata NRRL YB-4993]